MKRKELVDLIEKELLHQEELKKLGGEIETMSYIKGKISALKWVLRKIGELFK